MTEQTPAIDAAAPAVPTGCRAAPWTPPTRLDLGVPRDAGNSDGGPFVDDSSPSNGSPS